MATTKFKYTVDIPDDVVRRLQGVFPGKEVQGLVLIATKKLIGEAELRKFAAEKNAEVQAEAQRLNEELGLVGEAR